MYPRLVLLKQFLRDDGAIFVSIDDNEAAHLRSLMDEVFGQSNFLLRHLSGKHASSLIVTLCWNFYSLTITFLFIAIPHNGGKFAGQDLAMKNLMASMSNPDLMIPAGTG